MSRILVLGASGMLGNAVFNLFLEEGLDVFGTIRSNNSRRFFSEASNSRLLSGVDVLNQDVLIKVFGEVRPDIVINCVGLIKQLDNVNDPLTVLPINSLFPHKLASICKASDSRMVHISTDCVFNGSKGGYREEDVSDAVDLYGKSKYIGEIHDQSHVVTLRTSIIGHELSTSNSLIDWFLSSDDSVKGYCKAIFSGLPTIELAKVIKNYILACPEISGLYHVSASPISKHDLLKMVAKEYEKEVDISKDETVVIDRSLDSSLFRNKSGYESPSWFELIKAMKLSRRWILA